MGTTRSSQARRQTARTLLDLPEELLLIIGEQMLCTSTLSTLCLVSKDFHRVFTPLLYKTVWSKAGDMEPTPHAPDSHLPLVKRLMLIEPSVNQLINMFCRPATRKMKNLRSVV